MKSGKLQLEKEKRFIRRSKARIFPDIIKWYIYWKIFNKPKIFNTFFQYIEGPLSNKWQSNLNGVVVWVQFINTISLIILSKS